MGSSFACNYTKFGISLLTGYTSLPARIAEPAAAERSKGMLLQGERAHQVPQAADPPPPRSGTQRRESPRHESRSLFSE